MRLESFLLTVAAGEGDDDDPLVLVDPQMSIAHLTLQGN